MYDKHSSTNDIHIYKHYYLVLVSVLVLGARPARPPEGRGARRGGGGGGELPQRGHGGGKRELEYRIPRLHYPVKSRRFPEMSGDCFTNKTSFL